MSFTDRVRNAIDGFKASGSFSILNLKYGNDKLNNDSGPLRFGQAVAKGYKNLVWVNRCVSEIGKAVGSVPWVAVREKAESIEVVDRHPFGRLMEKPNPWYSRRDLVSSWAIYLSLSGNSYWEVVRNNAGKPMELFSLRPDWVTPIPDPETYISGYKIEAEGIKDTYEPDNIIHFKYVDPLNEYVGMSPLQAAARTLDTETAAINWNKAIFDNSAMPGGFLKVPGVLGKEQKKRLEEDLSREFSTQNIGKPMVLWGGLEWQKMTMDQKDLDWLKQRQLNKFEICSSLGVPPQIVGANEDPTYANYEIAREAFWEDTVIPLLEWLKTKMNNSISYGDGVTITYDLSDVPAMRSSFLKKVNTAGKLFVMGYPINMINKRLRLGFKDVPWGNVWWAQMNMMPVSSDQMPDLSDSGDGEGKGKNPFEGGDLE